jgi:hypothetical protein
MEIDARTSSRNAASIYTGLQSACHYLSPRTSCAVLVAVDVVDLSVRSCVATAKLRTGSAWAD